MRWPRFDRGRDPRRIRVGIVGQKSGSAGNAQLLIFGQCVAVVCRSRRIIDPGDMDRGRGECGNCSPVAGNVSKVVVTEVIRIRSVDKGAIFMERHTSVLGFINDRGCQSCRVDVRVIREYS